jgi:hypothetical protein
MQEDIAPETKETTRSGRSRASVSGTTKRRWCGVVWCGVVGCGGVWCGVVWCGVVWCGVVWCMDAVCVCVRTHAPTSKDGFRKERPDRRNEERVDGGELQVVSTIVFPFNVV